MMHGGSAVDSSTAGRGENCEWRWLLRLRARQCAAAVLGARHPRRRAALPEHQHAQRSFRAGRHRVRLPASRVRAAEPELTPVIREASIATNRQKSARGRGCSRPLRVARTRQGRFARAVAVVCGALPTRERELAPCVRPGQCSMVVSEGERNPTPPHLFAFFGRSPVLFCAR